MNTIAENLNKVRNSIPAGVQLVAVSKTYPAETIHLAYQAGQRVFGENRVQEMMEKQPMLPPDIQWHMIGHLQKNKVKHIAPFVSLIHAVDNIELLATIDKEAKKIRRPIACLIQVHIAEESSKFGFSYSEAEGLFADNVFRQYNHVIPTGLMGIATFTDNHEQVRTEFAQLAGFFKRIKSDYPKEFPNFNELSMGMSGDYQIAIEEGATMVRIGSAIFGTRN